MPDHATNTRTGACSVPRPGKEPYEGGLLVFHESSKSSKGLGFRVLKNLVLGLMHFFLKLR